ncbi:MAG TPA: hypothetical protein PKA64_17880, partial [Myxococcota bacterium]|nr:hypothetical protein [Myxococcota bacterium]
LPAPIAAALVALHRALGLRFGAADLLQTPDGAYRFLEVNSTGGFLWVSDLHGGAALRAVLGLLRDPWTGIGRGCPPRGRQLPTPHAGRPGEDSP